VLADGPVVIDDLLQVVAGFVAVGHPGRRPDIPGADDSLVTNDNCP